jgi:asparagine synthase (glutamine-hydrolysing)
LTVNDRYFASYLFLWPEAHLTPYREIQQVAPGGYVQITNEKIVIESYWTFDTRSRIRYKSDADYEAHFRHVFCESVRRRLRSDTPILAELSGGLDSSSIVCVADDIIESEGLEIRLDTTSRYDPCDPGGDERRFFSRVEERRGRAGFHVDKSQGPLEFPLEFYEFVAVPGSMGNRPPKPANNPFASNGDSGHRVLLSGTGGDEVLGGIPDPRPQLADLVLTFHWGELARQLMAWSLIKRRPLIHLLGQSLSLCVPLSLRICTRDEYKPVPWLHPRFLKQHWFAIRELSRSSIRGRSLPVQRDYAETIATLSRQMCLTSAHPHAGQERRYPYLDQSLVQFLFSIPAEQLLRPGQRRSLMRRALANIVPNEILSRSTKAIGGRVYMAVFENQWQRLEKLFAAPISAELGYINARAFVDALRSAKNGDAPHLVRLLRAIALEVWLQDLQNRGVIRVSIPGSRATHETSFRKLVPG